VRIALFNAVVGAWLAWLVHAEPGMFAPSGLVAVIAAMAAGGIGRNLQVQVFSLETPVVAQRVAAIAMGVVAVGAGVLVYFTAANEQRHASLFAIVLACVLLRRAMPVRIPTGTIPVRFAVLFVFAAAHFFGDGQNIGFYRPHTESTGDATNALAMGSMLLLIGVVIAASHWINALPSPKSDS